MGDCVVGKDDVAGHDIGSKEFGYMKADRNRGVLGVQHGMVNRQRTVTIEAAWVEGIITLPPVTFPHSCKGIAGSRFRFR